MMNIVWNPRTSHSWSFWIPYQYRIKIFCPSGIGCKLHLHWYSRDGIFIFSLLAKNFQIITSAKHEGYILVWAGYAGRGFQLPNFMHHEGGGCKIYKYKDQQDVISLPDLYLINFPAISITTTSRHHVIQYWLILLDIRGHVMFVLKSRWMHTGHIMHIQGYPKWSNIDLVSPKSIMVTNRKLGGLINNCVSIHICKKCLHMHMPPISKLVFTKKCACPPLSVFTEIYMKEKILFLQEDGRKVQNGYKNLIYGTPFSSLFKGFLKNQQLSIHVFIQYKIWYINWLFIAE